MCRTNILAVMHTLCEMYPSRYPRGSYVYVLINLSSLTDLLTLHAPFVGNRRLQWCGKEHNPQPARPSL